MCGVKFSLVVNCFLLVIFTVINGAGCAPWLTWAQTSRRWTRMRAIMDPVTWIGSQEKPYHLLLSSESAVDKAWFAIGYDQREQFLYWSDTVDHRIYRQKQNDSLITRNQDTIELVYEGTSSQVLGLAVDWYSGAVYWTDAEAKRISLTRWNSGRQDLSKIVVETGLDQPSGVVVHPANGVMYFSDKGTTPEGWKIEKASLKGENREVLLSQSRGSDIGQPECLSYDYVSDTLYWVDSQNYMVKAYNTRSGGGQVQTVIQGLTAGISWPGIANFQEYIFLSAQADLQIHAYRKSDGALVKSYTIDATPHHLVISGQVSNPPTVCSRLGCEHFCVSLGGGEGECVCADGYYLELDKRSCLSVDPQYIYSRGSSVWHADVTIPANSPLTIDMTLTPFITDVTNVHALAFHYKKNFLYLNDIQEDVLYRNVPLESTKEEITVNTRMVEGMSVNWLTDTLYWADSTLQHIMCAQLDGRYHKILAENVGDIKGLAVDAIHRMLFWIRIGQNPQIMRSDLDGNNPRVLVANTLNAPQGIAVDPRTSRLYWTDTLENRIYSVDLNGGTRRTVLIGTPDPNNRFYGVTVFKDYTTYTSGQQELFFALQRSDPDVYPSDPLTDVRATLKPNYGQPPFTFTYDVITYDSYMQPNTADENPCLRAGCQQHCFPLSGSAVCSCAIGFVLNDDGKSCDSNPLFSDFFVFTDPYHKQIYQLKAHPDQPEDMNTTPNPPPNAPRRKKRAPDPAEVQAVPLPLMDYPVSLDIDSEGTVYWIDRKASVIQSSPMLLEKDQRGKSAKLLRQIPSGFRPETLAVNEISGHVFYTDSQAGAVYRMRLDGADHDYIISGVGRCTGLALDPANNRLFWSELSARLMTAKMDGSEEQILSQDANLLGHNPRALAYRSEDQMLYWADELTGTIRAFNVTTRQVQDVFSDPRYRIIALTTDFDYIYFTTYNEKGIYRISRFVRSVPEVIGREIFARVTDIKLFSGLLIPPAPVAGGGVAWVAVGAGIGAAVFLLFLIAMIGLCAARRRKKPPPSPIISSGSSGAYDNNMGEHDYVNVANATANGTVPNGNANGIPPPPPGPPPVPPTENHARVHYTNGGFTGEEANGGPSSTLGPIIAVLPQGPVPKPRKTRFKKRDQPPKIDPNDFQLGEDQKIATVIQRLAHRLRNRLSSVRFSGDGSGGSGQDQHVPEYDPESADGVPGGPDRAQGPGPRKNIHVPPQLHRPPRGYAPASRSVPVGALKTSWGRGKHQRVMGKKK